MNTEQLFAGILPVPFVIFKLFIVVLLLLHLAFSLILMRQTKLMINVVEVRISPVIYAIAVIHLLFSVFILFFTILFI